MSVGQGTQASHPNFPCSGFGNDGGPVAAEPQPSAGGGGAGSAGGTNTAGAGKDISPYVGCLSIPGCYTGPGNFRAGGGGGSNSGAGGSGGGGTGLGGTGCNGQAGLANSGGGGGGSGGSPPNRCGGAGGSGVVIVKELNKASGVWSMQSQFQAKKCGTWPQFIAYDMDYLVGAGGGGGGFRLNGGGGAGGFRESSGANTGCYTASPLGSGVTGFLLEEGTYTITVGAGGAGGVCGPESGAKGTDSIFNVCGSAPLKITSSGGGAGSPASSPLAQGGSGAGTKTAVGPVPRAGNTPPVSPPQGNPGGTGIDSGSDKASGSGGGATAAGGSAASPMNPAPARAGGAGATTNITNSSVTYAGGGGGGNEAQPVTPGGAGGGGNGGVGGPSDTNTTAGTANTGGGGGGGGCGSAPADVYNGAAGGSGIVVTRFPSTSCVSVAPGTNSVATLPSPAGGYKVATFTVSGTLTIS